MSEMQVEAEKVLQREMEDAREHYEDAMASLRTTFFAKVDMVYSKLVREQNEAIDKYHSVYRAKLSGMIHDLRPLVDDEKLGPDLKAPADLSSLIKCDPAIMDRVDGGFFGNAKDYVPDADASPRAWFRRGRHQR